MDYAQMYQALAEAIRQGPYEQQQLVRLTDEAFAFLDMADDVLDSDQVLGMRMLLAHAETMIGRYFGT